MSTDAELKQKFWKALADSPFVFLGRDGEPHSAVPMTAQLDKDATGKIWFFTTKDHPLAKMGPATATFSAKDNQLFARFSGMLTEEYSKERRKMEWSPMMDAWFPGGQDDPNLLMLRMDLGAAEIWNSDLGMVDNMKMLLGFDTRDDAKAEHTETLL
ncbi:pyridoxamine 5'-phosphate oxidase family protein [Altererythrobacter sp. KTW20L]|uniref:pyridoxamine 5'-phosphate oxidase family protein n=1 Tax=Altererythrobacter sp. KTW20L TaxID=2942210 RepID=UPI0020C05124|nr:pyridoxamine 5'-phosphate oxidase family protein [Altererythrobacter sp. KTW20L]MCL6251190.1 pyridoxamine 5'-phosphate oxidase family protein [Altererythrobacter sp. KTW20L]